MGESREDSNQEQRVTFAYGASRFQKIYGLIDCSFCVVILRKAVGLKVYCGYEIRADLLVPSCAAWRERRREEEMGRIV